MNLKTDFTKYIAEQHKLPVDEKSIKKYISVWWANPRQKDKGGLELTGDGFARASGHITFYKVDIIEPIEFTNQVILWLDNLIDYPWYLTKKSIFVSNEKMAIQLVLFSGDIIRFSAAKVGKPKEAN
jgi:hypothetical protein